MTCQAADAPGQQRSLRSMRRVALAVAAVQAGVAQLVRAEAVNGRQFSLRSSKPAADTLGILFMNYW